MSTLQALLSFAIAAGLLTVTPGLDTALILRTATVKGSRAAVWVGLGISLGCLIWCTFASIGLGALLAASRVIYDLLRIAGAFYLVYLGVQLWWKAKHHNASPPDEKAALPEPGNAARQWFRQGLFTNLLNPKIGVFYVTFMPQFLPKEANVALLGTSMGIIHATEGLLWFFVLILATRPLSRWLKEARVMKTLDRVTGSVLIGFGAKLALEPSR